MITSLLKKVFGSRNARLIKHYGHHVRRINALEAALTPLDDAALAAKTQEFKTRFANGETLDQLLPEAFAVCREASRRVLGMRHFDVQLIGGMVLHFGKISEMRTGEGKTLVATLPAYLNAISGRGVHVVTVNDYLAERDAQWMGRLYNFLGLSVGINLSSKSHDQKQEAYAADITYGTNNEFGFDYLRDNMVYDPQERVQRPLNYAIVDEVDSILIDEARTPLIISGQAEDNVDLYVRMNAIAPKLVRQTLEDGEGDYWVDEKAHQVHVSEAGHERAEQLLSEAGILPEGTSLYAASNIALIHHLYAALRAHALYHLDQHYVVQNGEIVIVDEFTGRLMTGRRWSEGLHQAVEAKEGVKINKENQTLASITFQNYFRMYSKLSGMTGTADTEAYEFQQIYNLETVVIPTHRPMKRQDHLDKIFHTAREKHEAILADVRDCHERGQPVLVGTTSIENSELLSKLLDGAGLPHQVLNAKQHAREAQIVAEAGRPGMITIATNMAGRGTDIVLGGSIEAALKQVEADPSLDDNARAQQVAALKAEWQTRHEQVLQAGGLHIIGTERHESRRVDNQLRGRSGRQGDVGSSRFFLSLEDPLLRIFASDKVQTFMERFRMPEGEAIEHSWVTRLIENAQRKVEARNFDIRKQLLEYDDVANEQRKVIYKERNAVLESDDISEQVRDIRSSVLRDLVDQHMPPGTMDEQWDLPGLERALETDFQLHVPVQEWMKADTTLDQDKLHERLASAEQAQYATKEALVGAEGMRQFEGSVMLQVLDQHWREHLSALDHLRQGIHLRGYAQKNPKQEYKREAFDLFAAMLDSIRRDVTNVLVKVQIQGEEDLQAMEENLGEVHDVAYQHAAPESPLAEDLPAPLPVDAGVKVGRNDPCPCDSGLKFKACHGRLA